MRHVPRQKGDRRTCIFCGSDQKLSKEHLRPRWMRNFLPEGMTNTNHRVTLYEPDDNPYDLKKTRDRDGDFSLNGDHRGRTIKAVCTQCNNTWMSNLQDKAKPILIPLLCGKKTNLSLEDQLTVSSWSVMHSMVYEFCDEVTVAVTPTQRSAFMKDSSQPPRGFRVYISGFNTELHGGDRALTHHRGIILRSESMEVFNVQYTLSNFAKLFVFVVSCSENYDDFEYNLCTDAIAEDYGLFRVFPPTNQNVFSPPCNSTEIDYHLMARLGMIDAHIAVMKK